LKKVLILQLLRYSFHYSLPVKMSLYVYAPESMIILQIVQVLEFIGKKENLQLPFGFAARIAAQSNRNLRRAILFFETCKVQQYPFTSNQVAPPLDWEQYVSEIAADIMKEQSPKRFIMFQLLWLYCSCRMLMILFCLLLFFYCSTYLHCEICEYHGFTTSLDLTSNFKFNISGYLLCARSSTNYL
jgi:hypothetical protein